MSPKSIDFNKIKGNIISLGYTKEDIDWIFQKISHKPNKHIAIIDNEKATNLSGIKRVIPISNKVFLIHGHDTTNTLLLRNLLKERYSLDPIILNETPGKGRTMIEKFEDEAANVAISFALVTPDDLVQIRNQEYAQARPNVVFEMGWFYGRLGRDRVCILLKEGTVIHSDLEGIVRIQFRASVDEKIMEIEKELKAAGLLKN